MHAAIVTSIQAPTASLSKLARRTATAGMRLIVIGDRKSPDRFELDGADFYSIAEQLNLDLELARRLPENHYARKNVGYVLAIRAGVTGVFDTDDDNAPLDTWHVRDEAVDACDVPARGWVNAYSYFTSAHIWPRGLPLDRVKAARTSGDRRASIVANAPVQQGLVNGSPDVDAIWRLVMDREFAFDAGESIRLGPGAWCPFNSQSTWWFPTAYPLLYLPSHVSFRMTDIWRSFVAQRCLWASGHGVVFHGAESFQNRNTHDLLRDFEQEVPGYLGNKRLCDTLEGLALSTSATATRDNLVRCYEALVAARFLPKDEMPLVEAWLKGLDGLSAGTGTHE